ncbi:hypothetical protein ACQP2X_26995 [Actinoplanes sp. CA-131856]
MKRLFEDLLTIEVDVVLENRDRADSGRADGEAPDVDGALLQIALAYDGYLRSTATGLRLHPVETRTFAALRELAMRAETAHRRLRGADPGRAVILKRIHRNCDQIERVLSRDRPFTAEDVVRIRKIWEIGVDVIALQTVVQIDGDVVTRVGGDGRPAMYELHEANVRAAIECWQGLFALLAHLTAGTVRSFLAVVVSSRRWHRQAAVGDPRSLAAACLELRRDLFRRGGASVTTAYPTGSTAIRTVIQPDGDLVCHVDCDLLPQETALWGAHAVAVQELTAKVSGTVRRIDALLSWAGVVSPVSIASLLAIGAGRAWGALAGVALSAATVGAANLVDAVRTTRPDLKLLARWSALTVAGLLGAQAGTLTDLLLFAISLVPGLLLSLGLHWTLRRYLGLRL